MARAAAIAIGALILAAVPQPGRAADPDPAQLSFEPPVNEAPKWYKAGQPVVVRSLSVGQPLGTLQPGEKFLAFGSNASIVTLAYQGQVAFVPVGTASELYPVSEEKKEWRSGGPTLEQLAEKARLKTESVRQTGSLESKALRDKRTGKSSDPAAQGAIPQTPPQGMQQRGGGGGGGRRG